MSDLLSAKPQRLVLRSFRAVMDGATFCWDLFFEANDPEELPECLCEAESLTNAAKEGAPAVKLEKNLKDRVFVTCKRVDADGELDTYVDDHAGWLRSVEVRASADSLTVEWAVRIEGGAELGSPIAGAWKGLSEVLCTSAQQTLITPEKGAAPKGSSRRPRPEA